MEGFIATHPSGKEEWLVSRHGRRFRKAITKQTPAAQIYRNTITNYFSAPKALAIFHAEKKKAKLKGFNITDYDSTTVEPRLKVKAPITRRARSVKVFRRHNVPLEEF